MFALEEVPLVKTAGSPGSLCVICGSDEHSFEECTSYGGGQYMPSKDPRVLASAEREAQKAKQAKRLATSNSTRRHRQPIEPDYPPPPWDWGSNPRLAARPPTEPPLWYSQ